jgi:regulator of replication initiation timing
MISPNNEELVRRIAKLARQNQELEDRIKKLVKQNEKLAGENERLRTHSPEVPQETEKSLKFNMTTILFADIRGRAKVYEGFGIGYGRA